MTAVDKEQSFLVIGGGFSGSLLATILAKSGFPVTLINRERHPRFAIGESSTPTAGFILKSLVQRFDLQELDPLTKYGLWSRHYPQISCGVKRGFSYFFHQPGSQIQITPSHDFELLVAASQSRETADTHWYRQDVDAFLFAYAASNGVACMSDAALTNAKYNPAGHWEVRLNSTGPLRQFDWIIDASGAGEVMSRLTGSPRRTEAPFVTNTSACYGHFRNVPRYDDLLTDAGMDTSDFPFPSDDAAQHHMFNAQWLWSLRFENGISSLGLVTDLNRRNEGDWEEMLNTYPAMATLLQESIPSAATPELRVSGRMQRQARQGCGPNWVALPNTIGFVDPLHSTGIAHSLSGVERLAEIFLYSQDTSADVSAYASAVYKELHFIDRLISGCYKLMPSKRHFEAYCMLYFTAAHNYETQRMESQANRTVPGIFLSDDPQMVDLIEQGFELACRIEASGDWTEPVLFEQQIRNLISPVDRVGLCNPELCSMYASTAVL